LKKKIMQASVTVALISSLSAMPAFAAIDYNASLNTLLSSLGGSTVTAEASATSAHEDLKKINLNVVLKTGTKTITDDVKSGNPTADWIRQGLDSSKSHTLNAAVRSYYTDGTSSDQIYSSSSW
jgi:hypothetical protein